VRSREEEGERRLSCREQVWGLLFFKGKNENTSHYISKGKTAKKVGTKNTFFVVVGR